MQLRGGYAGTLSRVPERPMEVVQDHLWDIEDVERTSVGDPTISALICNKGAAAYFGDLESSWQGLLELTGYKTRSRESLAYCVGEPGGE